MKLRIKQITLVIILVTLVGLVPACTGTSTSRINSGLNSNEALPVSPVFRVSSLTVNPPETNPGVQIFVTAKVTNTGSIKDSYTPEIRIDSVAGRSLPSFHYLNNIDIAASETEFFSFVIPSDTPGIYKVTWGELSEEYTVVKADKIEADNHNAATKVTAPDFAGLDVVTNQKITLSQFKGSMVLLNFVNYGCDPALNSVVSKQLLTIRELKSQRGDFVPVSVFCGCCPPEALRDFAEQNDLTWPWILDTDYSIVDDYISFLRNYGYPTLIFVDREQYIRAVAGYSDLAILSSELDQIISKSD